MGDTYHLKLGFIGMVNRSQQDIVNSKPISQMIQDEENFFLSHPIYKSVASKCGTNYLAKTCNRVSFFFFSNKNYLLRKNFFYSYLLNIFKKFYQNFVNKFALKFELRKRNCKFMELELHLIKLLK